MPGELTTPEAAALLGVQPKTISRYIKRGLIEAERRGRDYFIADAEIERFKAERRGRGRPQNKSKPEVKNRHIAQNIAHDERKGPEEDKEIRD